MLESKYPLFRLHHRSPVGQNGEYGYSVDVVLADVDTEAPGYDPEDSWTHSVKAKELAFTTSRASALAVLRLHDACFFQDWTKRPSKGWNEPLTLLAEAT